MTPAVVTAVGWFGVIALMIGGRRANVWARLADAVDHDHRSSAPEPAAHRRRRSIVARHRRAADDLPEVLDELARSLRSGLSLRQALVDLSSRGALAPATRRLRHELDLGRPISAAVATWIEQIDDPLADLAGAALGVVIDAGGTGAVAIDRVAATVRDRRAIQLETAVQASQARASALVIGLLPVGFFVLATAADPASTRFLIGTRLGAACLVAGLGLDALALWWMHRITAGVQW